MRPVHMKPQRQAHLNGSESHGLILFYNRGHVIVVLQSFVHEVLELTRSWMLAQTHSGPRSAPDIHVKNSGAVSSSWSA